MRGWRVGATAALIAVGTAACAAAAPPAEHEVLAAPTAVSCEAGPVEDEGDPIHVDPQDTATEELYRDRPPASGPHLGAWLDARVYDGPVDERAVVHNLEHGAVAIFYDADRLAAEDLEALTAWAEARNWAGLANSAGAGLIVAPFDGDLGSVVALRAWLVAGDCDGFDAVQADEFLREHFGAAGQAPERRLAPSLDAVLQST